MTVWDWAHVVLTVVMAYPVVVLLMFVLRALGWEIEPFGNALFWTGPAWAWRSQSAGGSAGRQIGTPTSLGARR